MRRADSLEKTPILGKTEGRKRRGWQRVRWLDGITDSMDMGLGKLWEFDGQEGLACCSSWDHKESDTTEGLNWTELNCVVLDVTGEFYVELHILKIDSDLSVDDALTRKRGKQIRRLWQ